MQRATILAGIARQLGVSLSALLTTNSLTVASVIVPGDRLAVPAGGRLPSSGPASASPTASSPATSTTAAGSTYTVPPGDYLIDIASRNGLTLKALLAANNLLVSSVIVHERQLALPPATKPIPQSATTNPAPSTTFAATAPPATQRPSTQPPATTSVPPPPGYAATSTATLSPTSQVSASDLDTLVAFLNAQIGKPYALHGRPGHV